MALFATIDKAAKRVNEGIKNKNLRTRDVSILAKRVKARKQDIDKIQEGDHEKLERLCKELLVDFRNSTEWKSLEWVYPSGREIKLMNNAAIHSERIIILAGEIIKDINKSIQKYTFYKKPEQNPEHFKKGLIELKRHLSDFLEDLIESLIVVIKEVKEFRGEETKTDLTPNFA